MDNDWFFLEQLHLAGNGGTTDAKGAFERSDKLNLYFYLRRKFIGRRGNHQAHGMPVIFRCFEFFTSGRRYANVFPVPVSL